MDVYEKKFRKGMVVGLQLTIWMLLIVGGFWCGVLAILGGIGWATLRLCGVL